MEEERRREKVSLCMFNSVRCEGLVLPSERDGVSFGLPFYTHDLLCEYHAEHLPAPGETKPAAIPEQQLPLPLL